MVPWTKSLASPSPTRFSCRFRDAEINVEIFVIDDYAIYSFIYNNEYNANQLKLYVS